MQIEFLNNEQLAYRRVRRARVRRYCRPVQAGLGSPEHARVTTAAGRMLPVGARNAYFQGFRLRIGGRREARRGDDGRNQGGLKPQSSARQWHSRRMSSAGWPAGAGFSAHDRAAALRRRGKCLPVSGASRDRTGMARRCAAWRAQGRSVGLSARSACADRSAGRRVARPGGQSVQNPAAALRRPVFRRAAKRCRDNDDRPPERRFPPGAGCGQWRGAGKAGGVAMPRHRDQTGDDARKRPAVFPDRPFPIHARFAVRPATMREGSGAWIKQRPLVAVMAAAPSSLDTVEQIA